MENKFYIYFHINPIKQEVFYVGKGHGNRAYSKGMRNSLWHNTINKYGYEIKIEHDNLTEEESFKLEKFYIQKFGRKDLKLGPLVNMTDGGDGVSGIICSEETKKKMSEAHKGKNTWTTGTKASEETKFKMSKSQSGRKTTDETKKKISESHKGIKRSKETIKKMSKSRSGAKNHNFGKERSEETKRKIGDANRGRVLSEETKIKMSESKKGKIQSKEIKEKKRGELNPMYGKKHSEETKQKMREVRLKNKINTNLNVL